MVKNWVVRNIESNLKFRKGYQERTTVIQFIKDILSEWIIRADLFILRKRMYTNLKLKVRNIKEIISLFILFTRPFSE